MKLALFLLLLTVSLGLSLGESKTVADAQSASPAFEPEPAGVYLGAWVGDEVNTPGDVSAFEQAVGTRLAIVHRYSDNPPYEGSQFDSAWADAVRAGGATPMLSWHPGFGKGARSLASVASGERDDFIGSWADEIRVWGHPLLLRMMWEQNASWYGWRADQDVLASAYVAAWRHIVNVFRSHGVTNVSFVWSPNVSGQGAGPIMDTYPGDDFLDWVALDGYPYQGGRGGFVDTFGPDYDLLVQQVSKPLMIAETGLESWSDEQKADAIRDFLGNALPTRFPRVRALVWFDEKSASGNNLSILQRQGPLSRAAFRDAVSLPYFLHSAPDGITADPSSTPPSTQADGPRAAPSPSVAPADAVNLLADPGLELGDGAGGWHPAWIVPPWVTQIVQRDNTAAASGTFSMRHASSGGESYTVYQEVPVTAGESYTLSASVLVENSLGFGKASLDAESLGPWGGVLDDTVVATWRDPTNGWTQLGGTVRAGRSATRARIVIRVTSLRGSFRVDDFSFKRSAT